MATPVSALRTSAFDVTKSVTVLHTAAWNVGKAVQPNMTQMADVPWISTYPS